MKKNAIIAFVTLFIGLTVWLLAGPITASLSLTANAAQNIGQAIFIFSGVVLTGYALAGAIKGDK